MVNTQMEIHLSIDHGGDEFVVVMVCTAMEKLKADLDARPTVGSVYIANTSTTGEVSN